MPALKHVHTYFKVGNGEHWSCADPYCTHLQKAELVRGKASLCNHCQGEFILTLEDMRRRRPRCLNCSTSQKALNHQRAKKIMEGLIVSIEEQADAQ